MLPTYLFGIAISSGLSGWAWAIAAFCTLLKAGVLYDQIILSRDWRGKTGVAVTFLFVAQSAVYGMLLFLLLKV